MPNEAISSLIMPLTVLRKVVKSEVNRNGSVIKEER